jgi:ATP-dependent Lon protease
MTGEITLRGRILPIGGLKEKILAAHRGGIKTVLVPIENEKDVREIPPAILKAVHLEFVEHMDHVLHRALVVPDTETFLKPAQSEEEEEPITQLPPEEIGEPGVSAH